MAVIVWTFWGGNFGVRVWCRIWIFGSLCWLTDTRRCCVQIIACRWTGFQCRWGFFFLSVGGWHTHTHAQKKHTLVGDAIFEPILYSAFNFFFHTIYEIQVGLKGSRGFFSPCIPHLINPFNLKHVHNKITTGLIIIKTEHHTGILEFWTILKLGSG